jgi:hypothetical protein
MFEDEEACVEGFATLVEGVAQVKQLFFFLFPDDG